MKRRSFLQFSFAWAVGLLGGGTSLSATMFQGISESTEQKWQRWLSECTGDGTRFQLIEQNFTAIHEAHYSSFNLFAKIREQAAGKGIEARKLKRAAFGEIFHQLKREDFLNNRICFVDGWMLSECEVVAAVQIVRDLSKGSY
ncbi:MAG: hypothetical protein KDD62_03585 [Bdellovibrionales bacterium]|nr:hypothetical protein [Bdellovibrionales bacterium]